MWKALRHVRASSLQICIDDGPLGNGFIDADGAQSHGAEGVSVVQNVQLVGSNGSMDSGGIVGAGSQLGAAEEGKKSKVRGKKKSGKQGRLSTNAQQGFRRDRDKDNGGLRK